MPKDITIPSQRGREDPIFKPATDGNPTAVFIFLHGLADSAAAIQNVADQFQQGGKLPYMSWILPNAKYNMDAMDKAWFTPHPIPSIAPSRPELAPDDDEEGMLETVAYLETLIDACVEAGFPPNRIILGGFSQGCAMSLLTHFTSTKYSGKLAGVVGLLGFLVLSDQKQGIQAVRERSGLEREVSDEVPIFLARGTADSLIPNRVWKYSLQGVKDLGVKESELEVQTYEGLTHTINGALLRDLCVWLEKVLPPV